MITRRDLLGAAAATLPAPVFAQGAAARTLRVVPQANLTSLQGDSVLATF